jgi:predicted PurR-regulated permease PerM
MQLSHWIGLLALLLALLIVWQIRNMLLLIFAAVVLAVALNTLGRQFQKRGVGRASALFLAIGTLIIIISLALWLVVPPFADQFQQMTTLFPKGVAQFNTWLDRLRSSAPPFLAPYLPDIESLTPQLQPIAQRLLSSSMSVVSGTLGGVLNSLLVIILALMMLAEPMAYRRTFLRCFPSFYRRRVDQILDKCEVSLRGWLIGILFNMMVIGTLSGLGLLVLGVRLPLANGVFAGLLTFIPNIGPTLSIVPPMAIAWLDAPWKAPLVLVLYFVIQQVETNLLTPYVMAQQVSLLPAVTLLSQVFFATFFGFVGLLLALPLSVVGQVWIHEVLVKDILDQWQDSKISSQSAVTTSEAGIPGPELPIQPMQKFSEPSNQLELPLKD